MKVYIYHFICATFLCAAGMVSAMNHNHNNNVVMRRDGVQAEEQQRMQEPCQHLLQCGAAVCAAVGERVVYVGQWGAWIIHQIDIDTILMNGIMVGMHQEMNDHND
jgi:hypothetical protein